jgi:hypothetical protein
MEKKKKCIQLFSLKLIFWVGQKSILGPFFIQYRTIYYMAAMLARTRLLNVHCTLERGEIDSVWF